MSSKTALVFESSLGKGIETKVRQGDWIFHHFFDVRTHACSEGLEGGVGKYKSRHLWQIVMYQLENDLR